MAFLIFSGKQQVLMVSFLIAILAMLDIRESALTAKLIVGFIFLFVTHYGLAAIYRTIWNSSFILLLAGNIHFPCTANISIYRVRNCIKEK